MYLKALEIQGFKSFPDRTRLTFEKDITAIVGPNGSGKSNLSDALMWVMGEQRTRTLRGSKMEDVIFGGTEKRGALGFAQVSLVLDNSAHIFDSDSSEITLTRRYFRSGESEYFINREEVRLRDIHELLMDTGLGRDGYSIIGQGRIDEIVSNKSTDRREVFEEAAGISRFRYRKEEAERRLERTEENLLRINDKIEELEMQVGPLKKQSELAKKYLTARDELRIREISLWMETLDKLHAQSEGVHNDYTAAKKDLEAAKAELDVLYASSESIADRMHEKDVESESARARLHEAQEQVNECGSAAAVIRANIKSRTESMERLRTDIAEQEDRSREVERGIDAAKKRIAELDAELLSLGEETQANNNVLEGCRMKLRGREGAMQELSDTAARLSVDGKSMDARISMLTEMEKDFEGYSRAVKTVMRETARGNLRGIHAPAANLLRTDAEYALAIETALGSAAQDIIVDTQNDGKAAIELLKRMDAGRATFQPIETASGGLLRNAPVNDAGYIGLACELVRFDSRYQKVFEDFLGRTVVAGTLSDAVRMSKASGYRLRIVTLDGQIINPKGSMTGGSSAKGTGILSRKTELEGLRLRRADIAEKEKKCLDELEKAKAKLAGVKYQLDTALEIQTELRAKTSSLEAERRTTDGSMRQLTQIFDALSGDSDAHRTTLAAMEQEIESFRTLLREREDKLALLNERVAVCRDEIEAISAKKLELEGRRSRADKKAQQQNADILELERLAARIEQKKLAAELEEKQLLDKLWDSYELSHSAAQALRQPVESVQKETRRIAELKQEISALGTPNIGAIEEYERINTRYEFLATQRDDVNKAKTELTGIIRDITAQMQELFVTRFREIDESFRKTFLELFGGGKAALLLEDEKNVLECGIEIKVQPPGKAVSNISLLSGGEKAFVAIALYFAILKVRPTPFCVMDEIEAALDEANVDRFADYLRRMSDKTQFLVITHRRGTMEESDMLYGVTMQEKGVSSVIELDLEEAKKTIEK